MLCNGNYYNIVYQLYLNNRKEKKRKKREAEPCNATLPLWATFPMDFLTNNVTISKMLIRLDFPVNTLAVTWINNPSLNTHSIAETSLEYSSNILVRESEQKMFCCAVIEI